MAFLKERTSVDERVARIASSQRGVFTRAQAEACGTSDAMISWRVRTGKWHRLHPRVYALAGMPRTWEREALAACFYFGPGAAISFRSAAAVRGFPAFRRLGLEITVPRTRNRSRRLHLTVHTPSESLRDEDLTVIDGIPVTSAARTLMDLATVESEYVVERCLDDALRRRLVSLPSLDRWLADPRRVKRRGARMLRRLVEVRVTIGVTESPRETQTLQLIRAADLPLPLLQYVIRDGDRLVGRVDLAYPVERVAIEFDGFRFHDGRAQFDGERARANEIVALGWKLLRLTSKHLDDQRGEVVAWIKRALAQSEAMREGGPPASRRSR